jgi:hypothetical protein
MALAEFQHVAATGTNWHRRHARVGVRPTVDPAVPHDPGLERAIDGLSKRLGARVEYRDVLLRGACGDND